MKRSLQIRLFAILAPLIISGALWVAAKVQTGWPSDPLRALSQIISLLTLTAFSIVLVIAARNRAVEKIYGGLDKSYALHGQMAKIAWLGMLVHPFLLIPTVLDRGYPFWVVLVPFGPWPAGFELARLFGTLSYYLFLVLVLITLYRRVDYQIWLTSHKLMGPAFLLGVLHTFLADSDVRRFEPLRDWMEFVAAAGLLAWVYKSVAYPWLAQQYRYTVESLVEKGGGIWELNLRPLGPRMNYEPGEFAFISVRDQADIPNEHHPFSISSTPTWHGLRFSFRESGNFTRQLKNVKPGTTVRVYGPYGEFTAYMLDEYKKQVWVGGGIGITPFLSMAHHEATHDDPKEVWLYYSVKKATDAVYHDEIEGLSEALAGRVNYVRHASEQEGFLSAERFKQDLPGALSDYAFLFCGPPVMMKSLKKQLVEAGVPANQIFFEEFNFV